MIGTRADDIQMSVRSHCVCVLGHIDTYFGFDHGVGHPLLLLYDAKAPLGKK